MGVLMLERLPIDGVPEVVRLDAGVRYAALVADPGRARLLADLVTGLAELPPGAAVTGDGPVRLVPADGGLLPHLTVLQNLVRAHRLARRQVPRRRAVEACREWAAQCGLDDVARRYPHELTPGRRRMGGVARALSSEAEVIVLEDAVGLPTWATLLNLEHNPDLLGKALLLITPDRERATGFTELDGA